ncbi:uncharacterized protein LOC144175230 [Haemaphysalis longicornis]
MAFIMAAILLSAVIALITGGGQKNYPFALTSKFGHVDGFRVFVKGGQPVIRYLSIPYAETPVGKKRFSPSKTSEPLRQLENTSEPRIINSNDRIRHCPQDNSPLLPQWLSTSPTEAAESCLFLNVWTPDTECLFSGPDCGSRAVIVFFHGGDLRHGRNRYVKHPHVVVRDMRTLARRLQCEGYDDDASVEHMLPCLRKVPSATLVPRTSGLHGDMLERSTSMDEDPPGTDVPVRGKSLPRALLFGTVTDEGFHVANRLGEHPHAAARNWLKDQDIGNVSAFLEEYEASAALPNLQKLICDIGVASFRELGSANSTAVWSKVFADVKYDCPALRFAARMVRNEVDVHRFVLDARPSFEEPTIHGGAGHYATVRLLLSDLSTLRPSKTDLALHELLVNMVASFANSGQLHRVSASEVIASKLSDRVGRPSPAPQLPEIPGGEAWPPFGVLHKAAVRINENGLHTISVDRDPCMHIRAHDGTGSNMPSAPKQTVQLSAF